MQSNLKKKAKVKGKSESKNESEIWKKKVKVSPDHFKHTATDDHAVKSGIDS